MQEATSFPRREKSAELFARAKAVFPGGVSSPVRAFKSVSGPPLFMKREMDAMFGTKMTTATLTFAPRGDR